MKLNLGCGTRHIKGFINIDKYCPGADCDDDVITLKSFDENTVEEIYSSHVVEHLLPSEFIKALKRWYELLKVNGALVIRCPNADWHLDRYLRCSNKKLYQDVLIPSEGYLESVLGKEGKGEGYRNKNLLNGELLRLYVETMGFVVESVKSASRRNKHFYKKLKLGQADDGELYEGYPLSDLWMKAVKHKN